MDGLLLRMLLAVDGCCRIGRLLALLINPAAEVAVLLFSANFGGFGEGRLGPLTCFWLTCRGGEGLMSIHACVAAGALGVSSVSRFGLGMGATFLGPWAVFGLLLIDGPKEGRCPPRRARDCHRQVPSQVKLLLPNFIETEPANITAPRSSCAAAGSL